MPDGPIPMHQHMRGVTLLELLVVVMIVGILAMIAYPNYRDTLSRSKRTEAKAALLKIATNQERFYLNNNTYTADMAQLGFSASDDWVSASGAYTINVAPGADGSNFTATATYNRADNESRKCATFSIDGRGSKTSGPYPDCWTRSR